MRMIKKLKKISLKELGMKKWIIFLQVQTCFALYAVLHLKTPVWYMVEFHIKFVAIAVPKSYSKITVDAQYADGKLKKSPKISLLRGFDIFSVSFKNILENFLISTQQTLSQLFSFWWKLSFESYCFTLKQIT